MKVVLMAAGGGTRMFPYEKYRQKCFLPVGNVPNTLRLVRLLQGLGVADITVLTGRQSGWAAYALRGTRVSLMPAGEDPAPALAAACAGGALLLYGDIYLTGPDLGRMLDTPKGEAAALLQHESAGFNKGDWLCADTADGRVRAFWGHPRERYANARSAGVFHLTGKMAEWFTSPPPVFTNVPAGGMPPAGGFSVEQCLQTAIEDGCPVEARLTEGPFVDMDFPWDYLEANGLCCMDETRDIRGVRAHPSAAVHPGARVENAVIGPGAVVGEGVLIKGGCTIGAGTVLQNGVVVGENCLIGENCVIEDYCKIAPGTVIGHGCRLGFTAEVAGVLMDKVAAVHNCELYGVAGTAVDIGAGTTAAFLRFDDAPAGRRAGGKPCTHPLGRAVFIGDYGRTGVNASLMPGTRIGANCAIGPGVVVQGELPHCTRVAQKQELTYHPWGPDRYGWGE